MNETSGKTASSLAITERKPHRPGGFVGIFSQLFDWNRKFAKKKLFSKKLLPPIRGKQASKKFGGDEKMPKNLHLIEDENNGGFPIVKKSANKHEMRPPGLVARLMGLESMPNVKKEKPRNCLNSVSEGYREKKCVGDDGCDREDLNLENGSVKIDSRPQKIRKTGQFERHAVSKFGSDSLHIKSVLLRSRKHYNQSKLSSPVKSPRISASRNISRTSRLIDVASRILEPGLQATNRAKCALTYSSSVNYAPDDDVLVDVNVSSTQDVGIGKSRIGQSSCKNCGNLLDVVDSRQNVHEHPFDYRSCSPNSVDTRPERMRLQSPMFCPDQNRYVVNHQNRDHQPAATEKHDDVEECSKTVNRKPPSQGSRVEQQPRRQQFMPWKDASSSVPVKPRLRRQNETSQGGDKFPSRARLNSLQSRRASSVPTAIKGPKDFVSMNGNLSRTTPKQFGRADSESRLPGRLDDSIPPSGTPARKRRTVSPNIHLEHAGTVNPVSIRQRNARCEVASRKELELRSRTIDRACIRSRSARSVENVEGSRNIDVVSFTFNSPLRQRTSASMENKERRNQVSRNSHQRKIVKSINVNHGKSSTERQLPVSGDALGTLLEQKLKELTSQEDRLTEGTQTKRSTTIILQELISALSAEQPISPSGETSTRYLIGLQIKEKMGASAGFSHCDNHLSPGSVLEATFSNECCASSSLDDSSACGTLPNSDYACQDHPVETNAEVLDFANSMDDEISVSKPVTDILDYVSFILQSINLAVGGLTESDLSYTRGVVFNAELLFGNTKEDFSIGQFLLEELGSVTGPIRAYLRCIMDFDEMKDDNKCKRFLFDCMVECLDKIHRRHLNHTYKTGRTRLPFCMDTQLLVQEVKVEVGKSRSLAGLVPDKIIEWEMSHSMGKWVDFETEVFESGGHIDEDIFQGLIEEVAMDL